MREIYSIAWVEWNLEKRLELIKMLGFHFTVDGQTIELTQGLSEGERQAFEFLTDPSFPIKFHVFDRRLGKLILELHTEYWTWRFNR